jgi:hypothetical protein
MDKDRYVSAAKTWSGKYSSHLLETIDWCLRLDHLQRPQSVLALQKVLQRERDPVVAESTLTLDFHGLLLKLAAWRDRR